MVTAFNLQGQYTDSCGGYYRMFPNTRPSPYNQRPPPLANPFATAPKLKLNRMWDIVIVTADGELTGSKHARARIDESLDVNWISPELLKRMKKPPPNPLSPRIELEFKRKDGNHFYDWKCIGSMASLDYDVILGKDFVNEYRAAILNDFTKL